MPTDITKLDEGYEFGDRDKLTITIKHPELFRYENGNWIIKGGSLVGLTIVHNDLEI